MSRLPGTAGKSRGGFSSRAGRMRCDSAVRLPCQPAFPAIYSILIIHHPPGPFSDAINSPLVPSGGQWHHGSAAPSSSSPFASTASPNSSTGPHRRTPHGHDSGTADNQKGAALLFASAKPVSRRGCDRQARRPRIPAHLHHAHARAGRPSHPEPCALHASLAQLAAVSKTQTACSRRHEPRLMEPIQPSPRNDILAAVAWRRIPSADSNEQRLSSPFPQDCFAACRPGLYESTVRVAAIAAATRASRMLVEIASEVYGCVRASGLFSASGKPSPRYLLGLLQHVHRQRLCEDDNRAANAGS